MSTSVAPAAASSGQSVQLALDPCAVVLVLMDETQVDRTKVAAQSRPAPSGGAGSRLDRYA